jgi:tRNA dimethylallyltransferase
MLQQKPLLICVVGPTAIGKTSLAIKLAKAFSTEIISADSRQFFKEMNIGTAVPSKEELEEVPHHFIQNKSIFEDYSVGDFERDSLALLKILFEKNTVVVMVGGSGLYVDAVVKGLDNFPEIPSEIREQLNAELDEKGIEALQNELKKVDPFYFEKVDIHNPHRMVRALEIYRATGKPYSSFLKKATTERDFNTLFIGLTAERETVYNRINLRVDKMVEEGLLDEAKLLFPHKEKNALQTVGYRELFQYFDGNLSKEEAISEIKKNTRRFAKRQNTWFKKNEEINWFDYQTNPSSIVDFIKEKNAL